MRDTEIIEFKTAGSWYATDMALLLSASEAIYSLLLAAQIALPERRPGGIGHEARYLRTDGVGPIGNRPAEYERALMFAFDNLATLAPDERLRVASIEMNSPGQISLIGLGEVVREFRELLKDLWFRNLQERELGRLAIAREHLKLERDQKLLLAEQPLQLDIVGEDSSDQLEKGDHLCIELLKNVDTLKQLQDQGRLRPAWITDHPDLNTGSS